MQNPGAKKGSQYENAQYRQDDFDRVADLGFARLRAFDAREQGATHQWVYQGKYGHNRLQVLLHE